MDKDIRIDMGVSPDVAIAETFITGFCILVLILTIVLVGSLVV